MVLTKAQYEDCKRVFLKLGEEALYMSHYMLSQLTEIKDVQQWKQFLMDTRTVDYVASEMTIIREKAINKMAADATDSNSVGKAQLINALTKVGENASRKEGPAFIYTYIPLNEEQKKAPNIRHYREDVEYIGDNTYVVTVD